MLLCLRTVSQFLPFNGSFHSVVKFLCAQRRDLSKILTLEMGDQFKSKRPMCPSCSKPARICLCARFKTAILENSVSVTILRHSLEKRHPLNSTRIATLGLKNVTVATVSDVNFDARFTIRLLNVGSDVGSSNIVTKSLNCVGCKEKPQVFSGMKLVSHAVGFSSENLNFGGLEIQRFEECPEKEDNPIVDPNGEHGFSNDFNGVIISKNCGEDTDFVLNSEMSASDVLVMETTDKSIINLSTGAKCPPELQSPQSSLLGQSDLDLVSVPTTFSIRELDSKLEVVHRNRFSQLSFNQVGAVPTGDEEPVITFTVGKYGLIGSLTHQWIPQPLSQKPNFDQIMASSAAVSALAKGFVVKKFQKTQLNGSMESEEFEIAVPPGSVLLFPTEESIGVEDIDFEVKNLIVLDGTWAKAKRIYNENPWLKLVPHMRLDLKKMSLYDGVRHPPKAGYLSTIESIVYALKTVGNSPEGLDDLLDVFESMVGDQRRCKVERLSKANSA